MATGPMGMNYRKRSQYSNQAEIDAMDRQLAEQGVSEARRAQLRQQMGKEWGPGEQYRLDMPEDINYQAAYDPRTMSFLPDLEKKLAGINLDKRGLDKFRSEALRAGPSAWANLAQQGATMEGQANMENLLRGAQGRAAEARSGMARRGGIGSGEQARLGRVGIREGLLAQQMANRDLSKQRLGISMQDEQNRIGQLGRLPEMEIQALEPEFQKTKLWGQGRQFDIGNALQEARDKNKFAMDKWNKQMEAWGAGETAAVQADNSGSWLCTEAAKVKPPSEKHRRALGKLLRFAMRGNGRETKFYLRDCHELVTRMQRGGYDWAENTDFVDAVVKLVEMGDLTTALTRYRTHVLYLMDKFWPEGRDKLVRRFAA